MNINLKGKRKLFCEEYLKDFNATQSAIRSGYSKRTAYSQGQRLLKDVEIQKYIDYLKQETFKRNQLSVDELVSMLAEMSTWDAKDIYNEHGKIKPLSEWPKGARMSLVTIPSDINDITERSLKFVDRKGTIVELMKYNGAYVKDNEQKKTEVVITGMKVI